MYKRQLQDDNKQLRENLKSVHEDTKILNENLKSVRDEAKNQNKKIFAAIHEQAKQNKIIVEAAESKIMEKVASIRVESESAIDLTNTRVTECETRVIGVEECMREQTAAVNESINTHENKLEALEQKIKQIQRTTPVSYTHLDVYKRQDVGVL